MQEHEGSTAEFEAATESSPSGWLEEIRAGMEPGARCLACRDEDDEVLAFGVGEGWSRIGRSATADVRLDDPSVSRRHALVVSEAGEPLRVLDDRSLNGILVNGEAVEWAKIDDGDELTIGRYRLFALEA
ncbi:MAG TPA: FHA domain-containing protein [Solirubrobacterales bacterium]|nr:FHA domain-containing protein [Solirubrobacterales bacterium]